MIPGFGAHYRVYRLAAALDRLRDLPHGTTLSVGKAARLLGMKEAHVRELLRRHAPGEGLERNVVSAATLRRVARQVYDGRKRH